MATTANADNMSELLTKVNLAYDSLLFYLLTWHPGKFCHKVRLRYRLRGNLTIQTTQWFDNVNFSNTQVSSSSGAHYVPPPPWFLQFNHMPVAPIMLLVFLSRVVSGLPIVYL